MKKIIFLFIISAGMNPTHDLKAIPVTQSSTLPEMTDHSSPASRVQFSEKRKMELLIKAIKDKEVKLPLCAHDIDFLKSKTPAGYLFWEGGIFSKKSFYYAVYLPQSIHDDWTPFGMDEDENHHAPIKVMIGTLKNFKEVTFPFVSQKHLILQ